MNNAGSDDDDGWDWDDDESVETESVSKQDDDCAIDANNLHHFGFYNQGQSQDFGVAGRMVE